MLVVIVCRNGVILGSDFCFVDVCGGCVMSVCVITGLGVRLFSYGLGNLLCVVKGQDHRVGVVFCSRSCLFVCSVRLAACKSVLIIGGFGLSLFGVRCVNVDSCVCRAFTMCFVCFVV